MSQFCAFRHRFRLPGCLADAGNLTLVREFSEANSADAVVTQISMGTAADLAAVVVAGGELGFFLLLENHCFSSHSSNPPIKRRTEPKNQDIVQVKFKFGNMHKICV